jgi:ABC-2 type transport system ATP-binding protein
MDVAAVRVEELVKVYTRGGRETRAVDHLTFSVPRGTIFGLLGPNGAGKTTTLGSLTTLARPTSGAAAILGHDVVHAPLDVRRLIGVVVQEQAADLLLSVRDNLVTFARFHGQTGGAIRTRVDETMARFGLDEVADRKVQDLSGGVRRRVQVAKMFLMDLPIVFLDEFSTGMDALLKRDVMALIRAEARQGRTFVLTTHILSEAEELCDDILIVNAGRELARGTVASLRVFANALYDVTVTFDQIPEQFARIIAPHSPVNVDVRHNTVAMQLKQTESGVLELLSQLSQYARVQHLEISSASLEDIFVQLLQNRKATE